MHKESHGKTFLQALLRSVPVMIVLSLITFSLDHVGWLRSMETTTLDSFLSLNPPNRPQHVVLVAINDEDYSHLFNSTSPLNREKLLALIQKIAAGKPSVIAVDVDTSAEGWGDPGFLAALPGKIPVVWGRAFQKIQKEGKVRAMPVLGGKAPQALSGIAALPKDWDGIIRRYRPFFNTTEGVIGSFPKAIADTYRLTRGGGLEEPGKSEAEEDHVLNFSAARFDFQATDYEPLSATALFSASNEQLDFEGKIVLVGGEYQAARDYYPTPLGESSGLRLIGYAVECVLQNKTINNTNELLMTLMDLLIGIGMVALHHYLPVGRAFWLSVLVVPLAAILASHIAFSTMAYWANFVPMLLGMLIDQLYGHAKKYRTLRRELEWFRGGGNGGESRPKIE